MLTPDSITPEQAARFWSQVDRSGGPDACHPWTGGAYKGGYGRVTIGGRGYGAHRVAYVLAHGPLPPDKPFVLHKCDNPPCCNGACLFAGTHAENVADARAKGRLAFGRRNGAHTRPDTRARGERHSSRTKPESVVRGEQVHTARLTADIVREIRARRAAGETGRSLAREFGVAASNISRIVLRQTWRHVA